MSNVDLLQVNPVELKFIFELKKQISCSMQLSNKSDKHVAFKVKTTNPKKYCVKPNIGVLLPRSTFDVIVTMQAQKDAPTDLQCKDKFMIQSVVVSPGTSVKDITRELFNKGSGNHIEEFKMKVFYVSPPMSSGDLLQFDPVELQFPYELNKQISCSLKLSSMSDNHVAFKVLLKNSKNYTVRPNCGVILPRSTCDVIVTLQAQKDAPTELQCNEKLKIQSVVVFNEESGNHVEERELRVSYVLPPRPPSLVQEVSKEGLSKTASVSDNFTAYASEYKLANPKVLDWRGKLISLFRKLRVLFVTNKATGDYSVIPKFGARRKASAQKQGQLTKDFVEDVTEINVSHQLESNEERIIREQRRDDILAPLLTKRYKN